MLIRQEESTPVGDYFHDSGLIKIFDSVKNSVDEFEVETDDLMFLCDELISRTKALKNVIRKAEEQYKKSLSDDRLSGLIGRRNDE